MLLIAIVHTHTHTHQRSAWCRAGRTGLALTRVWWAAIKKGDFKTAFFKKNKAAGGMLSLKIMVAS